MKFNGNIMSHQLTIVSYNIPYSGYTMNKIVLTTVVLLVSIVGFSGCAKSTQCKMPDNSNVRISVLEDNLNTVIIRDRWNPIMEAVYSEDVTVYGNVIIANRSEFSKLHVNTVFMPLKIELDGDKKTVQLGEDKYACEEDILDIVQLVKKIEKEKVDKRIRSVLNQ